MHNIEKNLDRVRGQIAKACSRYDRQPEQIRLLAVSKTKPIEDIQAALRCGQTEFGESYLQEAEEKIAALTGEAIIWHFIGPIQSNKTRPISELFDWVQSIDRIKIARRLNDSRPDHLPPLKVLLQVNIDQDPNKAGIAAEEIFELAEQVIVLPRLELRGLMAIPAIHEDFTEQRKPFARMHEAFVRLRANYPDCDTLSMGMSADMNAAIAEGSTLVRIGTAIFGARKR